MEKASMVRPHDRKSSIETEPRTLDIGEIQFAREAAMYVMNTRSIEEAIRIFTEGLEPVMPKVNQNVMKNSRDDDEYEEEEEEEEDDDDEEVKFAENHLQLHGLRDVFSAPF